MPPRPAPRAVPPAPGPGVGRDPTITSGDGAADALLARLQLRHLRCLQAVADHGHLGRAAQQLCVTQPAVTKTLNELEGLFGLRLFERGRHGARPTAEAEALLPHVRQALQALRATVEQLVPGRADRVLQLGVLPTVAPALLPPVLADWARGRDPGVLRVHTGRNAALLGQLRRGELDLVVGRLGEPEAMAGLAFEHLYAEPLVLVARDDHPVWAARSTAQAPASAAFAVHPLLLPLPGTLIRQVADAWMARHRLQPAAGVVETLDGALALALLHEAAALWITPLGAVARELAAGRVRRWPHDITPEEPIGLIARADTPALPALRALRRRLRAQAVRHRGGGDTG